MYTEDEMLMLSGIQHYVFCPRQWALIHIEQQWNDNRLTAEGIELHNNVDDPTYRQKNGCIITLRSTNIASKELGLYGIADAIELIESNDINNFITHPNYKGHWIPMPIEYKRGHPKLDFRDKVQLCSQVICLEEQYEIKINKAALFYWETRSREYVEIDKSLREFTKKAADQMHQLMKIGKIPKPDRKAHCRNCSLYDVCLPSINDKTTSIDYYLKKYLYEETS